MNAPKLADEVARDGDVRWLVTEDEHGLFYFVYAGLDELVYYGRKGREAGRAYARAIEKRDGAR